MGATETMKFDPRSDAMKVMTGSLAITLYLLTLCCSGCFMGSKLDSISIDNQTSLDFYLITDGNKQDELCKSHSKTNIMTMIYVGGSIKLKFVDAKTGAVVVEESFNTSRLKEYWNGSEYVFVITDQMVIQDRN